VKQLEAQLGCAQTSEVSSFRITITISCPPLRLQYLLVRTELLALFPHQPSLGNDIYYVNYTRTVPRGEDGDRLADGAALLLPRLAAVDDLAEQWFLPASWSVSRNSPRRLAAHVPPVYSGQ
jgi:hypothetical protein